MRSDTANKRSEAHAHVQAGPPVLFYGRTPAPLHMLRLTGSFSGFYAKLPFSPGWGDKLSGDWTCGCALVCCWYAFYVLLFLVGHQRWCLLSRCDPEGTGTLCPPARRADLLINCRVGVSRGSQECSGILSSELITVIQERGRCSVIISVTAGSYNPSLFGC